ALESARERLVRAMNAADAAELPVLKVPLAKEPSAKPLTVDHEPVGADEKFAIPKVPAAMTPRVLRVHPAEPAKAPSLTVPAGSPRPDTPLVRHAPRGPAASAPIEIEPPDGMLIAHAASGAARPRRWPVPEPVKRPRVHVSRGTWVLLGVVGAVFAAGWIV